MLDPLARLRDETARDIAAHADDALVATVPGGLSRLLADFFAQREETGLFTIALELLADREAATAAQPRRSPLPRIPVVPPATVEQALGLTGRELRRSLVRLLGMTEDGAAMLTDRPAASLSRYPAARIAALADSLGLSRGRVLRAIAASARDGGQYVFAYRPGAAVARPAARPEDQDDVLAWGRALMEAPTEEA